MSWKEALWAILGGYMVLVVAWGVDDLLTWLLNPQPYGNPLWLNLIFFFALPLSTFVAVPMVIGIVLGYRLENHNANQEELKVGCFRVAWLWCFLAVIPFAFSLDRNLLVFDLLAVLLFGAFAACFVAGFWSPIIRRTILWGIDFKHRRLADELAGKWSRGEK